MSSSSFQTCVQSRLSQIQGGVSSASGCLADLQKKNGCKCTEWLFLPFLLYSVHLRVPYLSALEVCSRQSAVQILYLTSGIMFSPVFVFFSLVQIYVQTTDWIFVKIIPEIFNFDKEEQIKFWRTSASGFP